MKDRLLANTASLGITVALLALALFLFLLQPHWPVIEHWQADSGFKTYSGYMLLLIMAAMWLPLWLRKRFDQPQQLDLIKLMHQWLGVLVLLLFVLHASIARSGYLALQTLLLLALSGLGAGIAALILGAGLMPAVALMAAYFAVGQIQGVCDPTNTSNVSLATFTKSSTERFLKRTLPYVWGFVALALAYAAVGAGVMNR